MVDFFQYKLLFRYIDISNRDATGIAQEFVKKLSKFESYYAEKLTINKEAKLLRKAKFQMIE